MTPEQIQQINDALKNNQLNSKVELHKLITDKERLLALYEKELEINEKISEFNDDISKANSEKNDALEVELKLQKQIFETTWELNKLRHQALFNDKEVDEELQKQIDETIEKLNNLKTTQKNITEEAKQTAKEAEAWKKTLEGVNQISSNIWKIGVDIFKSVASTDDELRKSAVSIGLNASQYEKFAKSAWDASLKTLSIGVSASDLVKIQQGYNSTLGTTLLLTSEQQVKMGYLIKGTTLSNDGVQKMAIGMGRVGINTDETYKITEKLLNKAQDYGVSAEKATTTLLNNIGLAQSYNFAQGIDGLNKMVIQSSLLSINMSSIGGLSEKLFNVQGAVEMSAKLNVLGGQFSQIGDWSQLMFNAREDITELQDMVAKSLSDSAFYDIEKKMFTISSMNRQRLRSAADALGISVKELEETTLKQAQIQEVSSKLTINVDDETRSMVAMMAQNVNGVWKINIGDDLIDVKNLTTTQIESIKEQSIAIQKQADLATGFQTAWNSMKLSFQATLAPIITEMIPIVKTLISTASSVFMTIGKGINSIAEIFGPTFILGIFAAIKGISFVTQANLFGNIAGNIIGKKMMLAANGISNKMGKGDIFTPEQTKGKGVIGAPSKGAMIGGGIMGVAGLGLSLASNYVEDEDTKNMLSIGGGALQGASMGAMLGSALIPIPVVGTVVGGLVGAALGGGMSYYANKTQGINDGIITVKNGESTVTPINSRDDVNIIAKKPDGVIANSRNENINQSNVFNSTNSNIQLSPLEIRGDINLKLNGNDVKSVTDILIKNNDFIQMLTRLIHEETRRVSNNGGLRPSTIYV